MEGMWLLKVCRECVVCKLEEEESTLGDYTFHLNTKKTAAAPSRIKDKLGIVEQF